MSHIQAHVHEFSGDLTWDQHGDKPYWALASLVWNTFNGKYQGEVEVDGETWEIFLYPQESGLAPRPSDDVDQLYEYRLVADGEGRRHLSLLFQPRFKWDEMETTNGGKPAVPKTLGEAVNVRSQNSTYVSLNEYPKLIRGILQALAQEESVYWDFEYFSGPPHEFSSIWTLELYARVQREMAQKVIRRDGIFHRIEELVADEKGVKMDIHIDNTGKNTEIVGYNTQARLNERGANELLPGRQHGKQFKHYHPEYVRTENDDPLYHPKIGVAFKKGWNDSAVPWGERHDLLQELEENLINTLSWAGVPTRLGPTFVADDHFTNVESDRGVGLYDDPTPEIERRQEALLVRTFGELNPNRDLETLETLLADCGEASTHDLANGTDQSLSTIYRALSVLEGLVTNENGTVRFVSKKIEQDVAEIFERVENQVDAGATAMAQVLHMDARQLERRASAFQKWLNKYAVERLEDGERLTLKVHAALSRLQSWSGIPHLAEVLEEGLSAWVDAGGDPSEFRKATVTWPEPNGDTASGRVGALLR